MAEIELNVLVGQCLNRRIDNVAQASRLRIFTSGTVDFRYAQSQPPQSVLH